MRHAFQSFTPVAHPLDYDALASIEGCQPDTGSEFFTVPPFSRECVFSHSSASPWHNQPDTVSYANGPDMQGVGSPLPFVRRWAAWVATDGIRVGAVGAVTPPAIGTGTASGLYPSTKTTKLGHAFDNSGLLHIAIEKATPGFIEVKWYTNGSGDTASISFAGKSPLLFNSQTIQFGSRSRGGVVLYYLRPESPFRMYARFSQDAFAVERIVMPDMSVALVRLISLRGLAGSLVMYATDDQGRDVTLSTDPYASNVDAPKSSVGVGFESGSIFRIVAEADDVSSKSGASILFESGAIFDAIAEGSTIPPDKAILSVNFDSGEITQDL